ncbi:MAG: heme o synthase [Acidimicrobiaceae bacterium]|nr:heme o synthase [Acidimicrobiaceae bacterium]MCY4176228.1 heme o synthase [Acidimicrobiaceae bacterium]MCY4280208.1 heme o synthase [Acidimicrobiaceae bacterium]MCY4293610.1 heme o synthase [Acidimicrobiaceae bacterium]
MTGTVTGEVRSPRRWRAGAFVALTKPRIVELLLVTTVPSMILATGGLPSLWLMAATVVGGAMSAGGANALNMYIDRDIDKLMHRTRNRPLVTGAVRPVEALLFASALIVVSFVWLWAFANLLAAALATAAAAFYVFVYSLWLKRSSVRNIVIGGAAGAMPALVGWAAVTGSLDWPPLVLFAVVFYWTPPHFWALAIRYRNDYRNADVPMLPAVTSLAVTARRIVAYTVLLVALSLLLVPVADMGVVYLLSASVAGGGFIGLAIDVMRNPDPARSMRLFGWSNAYLMILFGAVAADVLIV